MTDVNPVGQDWSAAEIDLIVADYFAMLTLELSAQPYVKSHRNAELQRLTGRSHKSVEFKHQNISAVLVRLGLPWIKGYKPKSNFQKALFDGVERRLEQNDLRKNPAIVPSIFQNPLLDRRVSDGQMLFFDPPPQIDTDETEMPAFAKRLIRKFNPAERDARERCLEVKTTVGHLTTPFYLSENERAFSTERPDAFPIVRRYDFARTPRAFELEPPLDSRLILRPVLYRASFS